MNSNRSRARIAGTVVLALGTLSLGLPDLRAQTTTECTEPGATTPEIHGPTDINATSGNGRLSAGINRQGTLTVLKWPSPSFYDQIKYRTESRDQPLLGALPNEGAFLGVAWHRRDGDWRFSWLRNWRSRQHYVDDDGDEIATRFRNDDAGLTVVVRDVVAAGDDALLRSAAVTRDRDSRVRKVRVISFANFNPVYSKLPRSPIRDWCTESANDEGGSYLPRRDAVVSARSGLDESTGEDSGVALAMGFIGRSDGYDVGSDTYEDAGAASGSSFDDALDGSLSGNTTASGQADAALLDELSLRTRRTARTTVVLSAGPTPGRALDIIDEMRRTGAPTIRRVKADWWKAWLKGSPLPADAPRSVVRLAKRSLITIRQAMDRRGLIVASISTQSPYGLDWIRHGAYVNRALHISGHARAVRRHNTRYADLQATAVYQPPGGETTPPGNWAMNFYADGVVGGQIPYEIDETGLGIWTLWDHSRASPGDEQYLSHVYPAIRRAAHYLSDPTCIDLATSLQCAAPEEDNAEPTQTLIGAQAVWLGLGAAAAAAREQDAPDSLTNAEKWEARRDVLRGAIDQHFFDASCTCYTRNPQIGGTLLWPVRLLPYGSRRADAQAAVNWRRIAPTFDGERDRGGLEVRALLGNAYAWADRERLTARVRRGLRWVAEVPTTDGTGLLGEAWMILPDRTRVTTMLSQPHVWSHSMFYLAALQAYGRGPYTPRD